MVGRCISFLGDIPIKVLVDVIKSYAKYMGKIMQICWICRIYVIYIPSWWILVSVFQHECVSLLNWLKLELQDVVYQVYMTDGFFGLCQWHALMMSCGLYETCADPKRQVVHPSISHEFREARHGGLCGTGNSHLIYKNKSMTNAWNQGFFSRSL